MKWINLELVWEWGYGDLQQCYFGCTKRNIRPMNGEWIVILSGRLHLQMRDDPA